MREKDFSKTKPQKGDLAPGDILRCINGKTYRTVLMMDDERVIVEGRSGCVDSLSYEVLEKYWMKMIPKE